MLFENFKCLNKVKIIPEPRYRDFTAHTTTQTKCIVAKICDEFSSVKTIAQNNYFY